MSPGDARLSRVSLEDPLGRAWKFTSQRSGARIGFFTGSRNGRPHYCVRDIGEAFDMAHADKLFSPSRRLYWLVLSQEPPAGPSPGAGG